MIYCIHCQKQITYKEGRTRADASYIHKDNRSALCDAPSLEAAVENGLRVAVPAARPDLKRVTLATIRELGS